MAINGARGIVQVSQNACELLAAMVSDKVDELTFYAQLTGRLYEGDYGERKSSLIRGKQFEAYQLRSDALELRRAVQPILQCPVEEMSVIQIGADGLDLNKNDREALYQETRRLLVQFDKAAPTLLIQPQLRLSFGTTGFRYIAPDFLLRIPSDISPTKQTYVPGEIKSMITRDGIGGVANLGRTRQQCAVELLALRDTTKGLDISNRITNRTTIVCATPYGFRARAVLESIDAAVYAVESALRLLGEVMLRLDELRQQNQTPLVDLVPEFEKNYTDACRSVCILSDYCHDEYKATPRILGDSVGALLGTDTDLARLYSLLKGNEISDVTVAELDLVRQLTPAFQLLGTPTGNFMLNTSEQ